MCGYLDNRIIYLNPILFTFQIANMNGPNGILLQPSRYSVQDTINRLVIFLEDKGAKIYARINQQNELHSVGLQIRPLEFILFGNPHSGGAIIVENPIVALDLPLKIIAWEDGYHKVWVAYNDAQYIEERYVMAHNENSPLNLEKLVTAALKK
jgi:uncharacterized protein (DUF302 family)